MSDQHTTGSKSVNSDLEPVAASLPLTSAAQRSSALIRVWWIFRADIESSSSSSLSSGVLYTSNAFLVRLL
ncbi:hypothetical protein CRENBAI_019429 [Crenichthys baileyi]|uniref:Uncharacterized protein n=1 Tax=Crenichthys baileyi TaxID=28760 RepID=A0AAV9SAH0_9TELE